MAVRTNAGFLVGQVVDFPVPPTSPPHGFLYCGNTSYLRTDYPALFAKIGTTHGASDSLHFNVPDRRGRFVRGQDNGSGRDPDTSSLLRPSQASGGNTGDAVGSIQGDAFQDHKHQSNAFHDVFGTGGTLNSLAVAAGASGGQNSLTGTASQASISNKTSSESRPINIYTNYFIKY
jgi:microcystin-dependent protein